MIISICIIDSKQDMYNLLKTWINKWNRREWEIFYYEQHKIWLQPIAVVAQSQNWASSSSTQGQRWQEKKSKTSCSNRSNEGKGFLPDKIGRTQILKKKGFEMRKTILDARGKGDLRNYNENSSTRMHFHILSFFHLCLKCWYLLFVFSQINMYVVF